MWNRPHEHMNLVGEYQRNHQQAISIRAEEKAQEDVDVEKASGMFASQRENCRSDLSQQESLFSFDRNSNDRWQSRIKTETSLTNRTISNRWDTRLNCKEKNTTDIGASYSNEKITAMLITLSKGISTQTARDSRETNERDIILRRETFYWIMEDDRIKKRWTRRDGKEDGTGHWRMENYW